MEQPGSDFLARTGWASDEQAAPGIGDAFKSRADLVDGRGIAGEGIRHGNALTQTGVLAAQSLSRGGALDQQQQALCFEWLFEEIHGAATDGRNRGIDVAVAGEDDDRQFRLTLLDLVEHFQPVHRAAMEPHIQQHEARAALVHCGERGGAVSRRAAAIAFVAEHAGNEFADVAFVVNNEDV